MNEFLRDRIMRKLDTLPDDRLYQVLDYVEFLESKYAQRQAPQNVFTRFAEGLEDTLRAGKVPAAAISETMGLMGKAMGVLSGVAAAGRSVANDIVGAATRVGESAPGAGTSGAGTSGTGTSGTGGATSPGSASGAPGGSVPGVPQQPTRTTPDSTGGSNP